MKYVKIFSLSAIKQIVAPLSIWWNEIRHIRGGHIDNSKNTSQRASERSNEQNVFHNNKLLDFNMMIVP